MKNLEWPGIATAVGIILIVMMAADLSKWQTLAASLIAFGGGLLAYRGAVLKLRQDAAEQRREFLRRQLANYLKLYISIERYLPAVQEIEQELISAAAHEQRVRVENLRIIEPPEIAEAWEHLDVFPRSLIREIATIRQSVSKIDDLLFALPPHELLSSGAGTRLEVIHSHVSTICEACMIIVDGLKPQIDQLAPAISESERVLTAYRDTEIRS